MREFYEGGSAAPGMAGTLPRGPSMRELLRLPTLSSARVLAGAGGLERKVQRLNVMTVPDILPWVKEHEFLLATGYPLPRSAVELVELTGQLDARGLAGLGVKLGRYVQSLPRQMLRRADQLDFPVLEIPGQVGFDDILSQALSDIANRQAAILERAEEIHRVFMRVVLEGGGLPEITDKLSQLIDGAVVVLDDDGGVLAAARLDRAGGDGPPGAGGAGLLEAGGLLAPGGPLAGAARGEDDGPGPPGTRVVVRDGLRCAVVPVLAGAMRHGRILAVEGGRPLRDDVLIALERAATVVALDAAKALAVSAVERKFQSDFLHDLLDGRGRGDDVLGRAATLGWDLDRPLVVLVAEAPEAPEAGPAGAEPAPAPIGPGAEGVTRGRLTEAWAQAVRDCDPGAAVAGFASEFVAVVGQPDPARAVADGLARRGRHGFSIGVSRAVAGPGELPLAYGQATKALRIGRRIHGPGAVARFDNLGVFRLLSLIDDAAELRSFASETLGRLLALDPPERDDLLRTLEVLLACNLNVAEAARRLYFHYNTLRYRIAKLERLLGPFTGDPDRCLEIALALQILRLREVFNDAGIVRPG